MLIYDKGHPSSPPPNDSQSIWYRFHIEAMELANRGTSVIEGMDVTPGAGLTVDVSAGLCEIDGVTLENSSPTNVSGITVDSTHPRWALIYGVKNGANVTLAARMGAAGTAHYPPYLNLGAEVPVALIYLGVDVGSIASNAIQSAAIISRRPVTRILQANLPVTSNTTPQTTGLKSPTMVAGEVWKINGLLRVDTAQTVGSTIGWNHPGQSGGWYSAIGLADSSIIDQSSSAFSPSAARESWDNNVVFDIGPSDGNDSILISGVYPCTVGGVSELKFAQGTSDATAATLYQYSYVTWEKIG